MQKFKLLIISIFFIIPSSMYGIVGFGLNVIQDGMKLDGYVAEDIPGVTLEAYKMEGAPLGAGGYFFIDLSGWAIEVELNAVGGEYSFEFSNNTFVLPKTPFGWARGTTAITLKKNIADLSIPVLAKTAISVGVGTSKHVSTPRASVDMVKGIIGDDLLNADASNLEEDLIDYLKENLNEASGIHAQLGLRFKLLMLDTHLNFRYNIAENVYDGSDGYTEIQFKIGMGF